MAKPDFTLGKNMDHHHLKGRFTLRIWIPVEQVGLVIGRGHDVVHGIKRKTHVKSIDFPPAEPRAAWSPVVIVGDPTTSFKAYQAVDSIVEEVEDTAVAEFPLHIRRHSSVVGPRGSTLKRISAENAVRIFVPDTRRGHFNSAHQDRNTIQLEGGVEPIFSSLAVIIEAVYGIRATTLVSTLPSRPNISSNTVNPAAAPAAETRERRQRGVPSTAPASSTNGASGNPRAPARQSATSSSPGTVPEHSQDGERKAKADRPGSGAARNSPIPKPRPSMANGGSAASSSGAPTRVPPPEQGGKTSARDAGEHSRRPSQKATISSTPAHEERSALKYGKPGPSQAQVSSGPATATAEEYTVPNRQTGRKAVPRAGLGTERPTRASEDTRGQRRDAKSLDHAPGSIADTKALEDERNHEVTPTGAAAAPREDRGRGHDRPKPPPRSAASKATRSTNGQQAQVVVPNPGPLPSAEASEEAVRLPATAIAILQGHVKHRSSAIPKDLGKLAILRDIHKHTGTKGTVLSAPQSQRRKLEKDVGDAAGKSVADAAELSRGSATETSARPDAESGDEQALVLRISGPVNCVEVAVEALRRLGRGGTVRDVLNYVKKTSPHRRLTQQRRQEQEANGEERGNAARPPPPPRGSGPPAASGAPVQDHASLREYASASSRETRPQRDGQRSRGPPRRMEAESARHSTQGQDGRDRCSQGGGASEHASAQDTTGEEGGAVRSKGRGHRSTAGTSKLRSDERDQALRLPHHLKARGISDQLPLVSLGKVLAGVNRIRERRTAEATGAPIAARDGFEEPTLLERQSLMRKAFEKRFIGVRSADDTWNWQRREDSRSALFWSGHRDYYSKLHLTPPVAG